MSRGSSTSLHRISYKSSDRGRLTIATLTFDDRSNELELRGVLDRSGLCDILSSFSWTCGIIINATSVPQSLNEFTRFVTRTWTRTFRIRRNRLAVSFDCVLERRARNQIFTSVAAGGGTHTSSNSGSCSSSGSLLGHGSSTKLSFETDAGGALFNRRYSSSHIGSTSSKIRISCPPLATMPR